MEELTDLENTFIEEYEAALLVLRHTKTKAATILLSKALFALVDCIIFSKYRTLPKNHAERFRILERREEKTYQIVNSVWKKYTDTYSKPALKESVYLLQNAIQEVAKNNEMVGKKIKTCLEKKQGDN